MQQCHCEHAKSTDMSLQAAVLARCFDFPALKAFLSRPDVSICYDAMNGVNGPTARKILVEILGCPESSLQNCVPLPDFGGAASPSHGHADPNLKNAVELCKMMCVGVTGEALEGSDKAPTLVSGSDDDV